MEIIIGIILVLFLIILSLPKILKKLGLHPDYQTETYDFKDKKALIITTSHDTLNESGKPTGVYASEMTVPYYEFKDSGINVDLASIKGGEIPIEKWSLKWPLKTSADKRFLQDETFQNKVKNSLCIKEVEISQYDLVYIAGGWGAAYDLGRSKALGEKISQAYIEDKIIGAVCHGPLGLLKAKDEEGNSLLKNKNITAVTDKQVKELGITETPMHPETELKKAGVNFKSSSSFKDTFSSHVEIDGNIITGQNQNTGGPVAQKMMKKLKEEEK